MNFSSGADSGTVEAGSGIRTGSGAATDSPAMRIDFAMGSGMKSGSGTGSGSETEMVSVIISGAATGESISEEVSSSPAAVFVWVSSMKEASAS